MGSYVISKTRCPKCASLGKDQSHDNLVTYSDGHSYCYSCGYTVGGSLVSRFRSRQRGAGNLDKQEHRLYLPEDSDVNYPIRALDWVGHYGITKTDLLNNNTFWSESTQRLLFPIFGDGMLLAYQGRYFGPPAPKGVKPYPKWYGKGNLADCFNILGSDKNKIILVEDIISAIKLSKITRAMPLYGSHIGAIRFKRLRMLLEPRSEVWIYLDPDKKKEALVEARRGELCGLKTRVVYGDKDPKEESYEKLKEIVHSI